MYGLNWYDYSARYYETAIGRFTSIDPLAEKYYSISPYAYVANNPLKYIDPTGKREWPINETHNGHTRRHENNYGAARGSRLHQGVDINLGSVSQNLGTPIYATHAGTVTRIATIEAGDTNAGGQSPDYICEWGSIYLLYAFKYNNRRSAGRFKRCGRHPNRYNWRVRKWNLEGYTPHLHYELNIDGQRVNPATSATGLVDPQARLTPIVLAEVTVTGQAPATQLPQVNVPEIQLPEIRLPEGRR